MHKMEKVGIVFMILGIIIGAVMVLDIFSIAGDFMNALFKTTINVRFLNSIPFRLSGIIIGAVLLLSGGLLFKKYSQ